MRRLSSLVLLILSVCALAQNKPSTATQATEQAANKDYSDEGFVVEQLRNTYHFETNGTGKHELYAKIRVQSEAGVQQWGQVVVGYNSANEKIEIPYVRVLKKDGSTVTAP